MRINGKSRKQETYLKTCQTKTRISGTIGGRISHPLFTSLKGCVWGHLGEHIISSYQRNKIWPNPRDWFPGGGGTCYWSAFAISYLARQLGKDCESLPYDIPYCSSEDSAPIQYHFLRSCSRCIQHIWSILRQLQKKGYSVSVFISVVVLETLALNLVF